jgi:WD40 repeat protein
MDVLGIARFRHHTTRFSSSDYLLKRQLDQSFSNAHHVFTPGFSPSIVQSMSIVTTFAHSGCVNTANFNDDGTLLVTASDDLKVRIWKSSNFNEPRSIKRAFDIPTGHSSNIFHSLVGVPLTL